MQETTVSSKIYDNRGYIKICPRCSMYSLEKSQYQDLAICPNCSYKEEYVVPLEGQPLEVERDAYQTLNEVLRKALLQASKGKGKERHAKDDEPFEKQKICEITRRVGLGYPLGQAIKKAEEAQRLPYPRNVNEILGAINYLAAAVIVMEEQEKGVS